MDEEWPIAGLLDQPNRRVRKLAADVRGQAEAFFGKSLTGVGLKLPAAVAGGGSAAEIDIILGDWAAATVKAITLLVPDLRRAACCVPFADVAGSIAGLSHDFRPERHIRIELELAERAIPESGAAGEQLGPAGIAQRMTTRRAGEGRAAADEIVEVGRVDSRVAQCRDGIRPLIVGDKQQDVGRLFLRDTNSLQRKDTKERKGAKGSAKRR